MGRPTKLTPEIQTKICQAIAVGTPRDFAARSAGIAPSVLYDWVRRGKRGEEPFSEFSAAVEKAESDCVTRSLAHIAKAATHEKHWTAAAWLLERKHPAEFGQRVRIVVEEQLNEFLDKLESRLPPDVFRQVLDAAAAGDGSSTPNRALAEGGEDSAGDDDEGAPPAGAMDSGGVGGLPDPEAP